jgi:hypothetical protein
MFLIKGRLVTSRPFLFRSYARPATGALGHRGEISSVLLSSPDTAESGVKRNIPGRCTRGKTPGNRNRLTRLCFLNIAVDSIPGRTQVLRQVAQQLRAR